MQVYRLFFPYVSHLRRAILFKSCKEASVINPAAVCEFLYPNRVLVSTNETFDFLINFDVKFQCTCIVNNSRFDKRRIEDIVLSSKSNGN